MLPCFIDRRLSENSGASGRGLMGYYWSPVFNLMLLFMFIFTLIFCLFISGLSFEVK